MSFSLETKGDAVQNMVSAISAEGMTDWLVKHHGLSADSAQTVAINLREQFRWHRLQGRLDQPRFLWLSILARLFRLRQSAATLAAPTSEARTDG